MATQGDTSDNKAFASNFMLLKPEEVGVKGLYHILTSRKTSKKRQYFETQREGNLIDGGMLFISMALQKVLMFIRKPMAWIGAFLELWLNILSNNGGLLGLLFRTLRLKVKIPNKTSADYVSMICHLDRRVDIDSSIEHDSERYYEALSLLASKIAYENKAYIKDVVENHWKLELLGAYDFWNDYLRRCPTQAFIMREKTDDSEIIMVAFRGTEPFNAYDWCSDFDLSWFKLPGVGKMHAGFMKALGLQKNKGWPKEIEEDSSHPPTAYYYIRGLLRQLLEANSKAKFIVTGHSLGGALAIIFPSILALHDEAFLLDRLQAVYTFGQPRVGDGRFGDFVKKRFEQHNVQYIRFVYSNDMVPRIPFDDSGRMFKHFGTCLFYNSIYKGDIVDEEPFKNYFSIFGFIPMTLNAGWEIIRGFIYPFTKGPIYREGWLLFSMRLFGLIMPGMSAHIPQDYNNSTRLGSMVRHLKDKIEDKIDHALHK